MSKLCYISFCLLLFFSIKCSAQDWSFFDKVMGSLESQSANCVRTDTGIYIVGVYEGSFSVPPLSINSGPLGSKSIALAKYDYNGTIKSLKSYGNGNIMNQSVNYAQGLSGEHYFAFVFKDTMQLGQYTLISFGDEDIAICKILDDSVHWAKNFGSKWKDNLISSRNVLQVDNNGEILLCGNYSDTAHFDNDTIIINNWGTFPFFLKMDTLGNILWLKEVAGSQNGGNPTAVNIDAENNSYLLCAINSTNTVNIDGYNPNLGVLYNGYSSCLIKYNEQGVFQWVFHCGFAQFPASVYPAQVTVDANKNSYICGRFTSSSPGQLNILGGGNLNSNNYNNYYIIKVDSNGSAKWARQSDAFSNEYCYDVALNKKGEVFVLGDFIGTSQADGKTITSQGSSDILLSCYDTAGNHKWLKGIGGSGYDYDNKLLIDSNDHLLVMGITSSTPAYFDNDTYTANFNNQLFIARMTPYAIGAEDVSNDETLLVYPNPSNGWLYITLPKNKYKTLSIYNSSGQVVRYKELSKTTSSETIDCSSLASGTYFLECANENERINKKIIIE